MTTREKAIQVCAVHACTEGAHPDYDNITAVHNLALAAFKAAQDTHPADPAVDPCAFETWAAAECLLREGVEAVTGNDALDAMQALDELRKAAVAFTIQAAIEVGAHPQTMQSLQERLLAYVNEPTPTALPTTHDMWCVTADLMTAGHVNPFVPERRRDAPEGGLTYAECEVAARNVGVDLRCGACGMLFYTGFPGHEHDPGCQTKEWST